MLSEKNLGQKGKMSRNNKQKSQLNRGERPEGGAPFCDKRKAQQEEEGLLFPGKDSAKEKLRTLCFLQSSQLFFFPLSECILSLPCGGLHLAHGGKP